MCFEAAQTVSRLHIIDRLCPGKPGLFWGSCLSRSNRIRVHLHRLRWPLLGAVAATGFLVLAVKLRHTAYTADPLLDGYLEMAGSLIAFTFAANALIRFRGNRDRLSLILAFGFVLSGLIEAGASLATSRSMMALPGVPLAVPLAWMLGRTLLGLLLLAALVVEKRIPVAREPGREIAGALLVVGVVAYLTSAAYFAVPGRPEIRPDAFLARPWDLLPAAIFLAAAIGYWQRLTSVDSALDRALCVAAWLNVACHLAVTQSQHLFDAPYAFAHFLKIASYAVVLGGALLDNARLFDQVSHLATTDPLTGLANYRRLLDAMDAELRRSRRTGRHFSVLLLDLDDLKKVNDAHGHLVGSRALKRLGHILRAHSRAMDTAARYGGDEFAVILPEAGGEAAAQVAARICDRLAHDGQEPPITVSVGVSVYPQDGATIEKLLGAADLALYRMKGRRGDRTLNLRRIAACL
jgi:diguanylate cyclase (GGDEF)-like protein